MSRPELEQLPAQLRHAARWVGERLERAGHQAWIVGGSVRDLALGRVPGDVDIATEAHPERIEELFERTTAVGKAFGTIIVHVPQHAVGSQGSSIDVEVTTFRSDGVYLDARRPTEVTYSSSVAEDARRRDFTCNALYLGATSGEFQDPVRGLEDLQAGRLRCVGEARARFGEDGLRLLRLVRFEARFDLTPEAETLAGAREARAALSGVSPERVRAELEGILASPRPGHALRRLAELELTQAALPGWSELGPAGTRLELCARALESALPSTNPPLAFALLYEPDPGWSAPAARSADLRQAALEALERLRPSRKLRRAVAERWKARACLHQLLAQPAPGRAARLRLLRDAGWPDALRATLAWQSASRGALLDPEDELRLEELDRERAACSQDELFPTPLLSAEDLAQAGLERGPRWGALLEELEGKQLDLELRTREEALEWLAEHG